MKNNKYTDDDMLNMALCGFARKIAKLTREEAANRRVRLSAKNIQRFGKTFDWTKNTIKKWFNRRRYDER